MLITSRQSAWSRSVYSLVSLESILISTSIYTIGVDDHLHPLLSVIIPSGVGVLYRVSVWLCEFVCVWVCFVLDGCVGVVVYIVVRWCGLCLLGCFYVWFLSRCDMYSYSVGLANGLLCSGVSLVFCIHLQLFTFRVTYWYV